MLSHSLSISLLLQLPLPLSRLGRIATLAKGKLSSWKAFGSRGKNDIYDQYDNFLRIGNKNPEQVINLLNELSRQKNCDRELVKCITNHIYDFSEDFFCPQLIKVLENYVQLKYSDETLLGVLCNRIDDLMSIKSCLRTKVMINIYKQLNFHHPVVKMPLISQLNDNMNDYKNELISIIKNLSYLYVDACTSQNIMNRLVVNYDYYDKDIFTVLEAFSRLEEQDEAFIRLVSKKISKLEEIDSCCSLKDFLKFISAYKRLNLDEDTYLHTQFEKKINNIKSLSPCNISYILLLMLSTKLRHELLFEVVIMNVENYVNSGSEERGVKTRDMYYQHVDKCENLPDFDKSLPSDEMLSSRNGLTYSSEIGKEEKISRHDKEFYIRESNYNNVCNEYIYEFLPFHVLLLILLNYENINVLSYLLSICTGEYLPFYDASNLIKLLYSHTLLMVKKGEHESSEDRNKEFQKNVVKIFTALQDVYREASTNDAKILHTCFLYHKTFLYQFSSLRIFHGELSRTECFSLLPSSHSNIKFEDLQIVKCASSSYLKSRENDSVFFYLNRNDFFSAKECTYDNLLPSVRLKMDLLEKCYANSNVKTVFGEGPLKGYVSARPNSDHSGKRHTGEDSHD
ncbi:conserved Plasmodium protein, unknown function [Plasmodium ovale curtisi]|uniref:Heptatricopeptide repeat-containing protein n=2 Tax=Plasmodium ovale TaxID=36330 RepID=A0A1A8X142_PLAOA|nr:conserved Plasmodium protein, unknown function [Plasmodium ovale curtisi]SBS97397.1 conserved Plasmodium protein, unknown function [Plasmodium ovale curtisi]